ncbi:MAG TPA: glycosyltransferase family 4 protein [Noviherbaspirillum sp.]|uniref:glycosyltransferase family 4 protein n=1 Tax=Noviherbaspirillum sp. TaxID=1926288 RepID=UPI002B49D4A6|nr:glycosyltransferase family 4 protein [Noviherbaspirillum sp.]HJV87604.1 glycosyltransferase family 4 protein [Noviherbaspirillum sp.]
MKIAQVSPIFESVPPKAYGGTERVISYLTEELVKQGHEVTLFASGDSVTAARLVSPIAQSLRPDPARPSWLSYHTIQMDLVANMADSFDVIHFHTDYLHFPLARQLGVPHVTTMHGRLDLADLQPLFRHFHDVPLVSISDNQRTPLPDANWQDTVYHGLPPDLYSFQEKPGDYFAFIGRISHEKRVDRAIDIAKQCGVPIYIGAKIDKADEPYFNECIKPLLRHPLVQFVGEVNQHEKRELLEHARALLFPIDWPEPFGLVMIEAFSCGTPVIAYRHGSVPEIMEDGVTGFVVTNQDEAVRAAKDIDTVDRKGCRAVFDRRFTAAHMAEHYLRVYQQLPRHP